MNMYFPREVWFHIRSYEYQLSYPPHIQEQFAKYLKSLIRLPFLLKIENQKNLEYQYVFLKEFHPCFWKVFESKYIKELINRELFRMHQQYQNMYLKHICHGRLS